MDKKYFLLLKQHKITGLKYLCKHYGTKSSCELYPGSGTRWRSHLRKHGYDVKTTILYETICPKDFKNKGVEYSKIYNVVSSKDFANLVPEDGSGGHQAMNTPEVRKKATQSLLQRRKLHGLTEKEKNRTHILKHRIQQQGFTLAEINSHKKTSQRQLGKSMKERLNDPNYIDPRAGKKANEFIKNYNGAWNKGKTINELKGNNYLDPRSKPFKVISNQGEITYKCEKDFISQTNFCGPLLTKLKRLKQLTIKRQKNSRHPYLNGEIIYLIYI